MRDVTHTFPRLRLPQINLGGLGLFAALIAISLPIFWIGFAMLGAAWITPEYSHGPLIPLISLYLFLRERRSTPRIDTPKRTKPGIALLGCALVLGIFGNLVAIPDIAAYALIMWTGGLMLICMGWEAGKHHWKPVLHLIFMLPLPQFLYWQLTIQLQLMVPLTIVMNSIRIGMIGVLVNAYGISHAEGFLHFFEGWVIFGTCIGLLFLTALGLQRLTRNPKPLRDVIDVETDGLGGQVAQVLTLAPSRGMIAGLALSGLITAAFVLTPSPPRALPERDIFAIFPRSLGDWQAQIIPLDPEVEAVLDATDYINATYMSPNSPAPVTFFSAWYASQTEGAGIHSPEVCLPVGGWEIFTLAPHAISMPGTIYGDFDVNRAVIQKGLSKQLVYYWFDQRGRRMTNDFAAKATVVYDSLTRGRTDGAMVRFTTPIGAKESEAAADARIQAFMAEALGTLPTFVPE